MLQHQRDVPLRGSPAGYVLLTDVNGPGIGTFKPGNQPKRRGLAGTCGAEQHEELAIRNLEIEIGHRGVTAEFLGDAFKPDVSHVYYLGASNAMPDCGLKK